MTPHALFDVQMKWTTLMLEAQTVMALRLMAMSGMIPARPGETTRMVAEKGPAMGRAFADATEAMMRGKNPDEIMIAAMAPIGRKVRSNRKRLTR